MGIGNTQERLQNQPFITPEIYKDITGLQIPQRGDTLFFACRSGKSLANDVLASYNQLLKKHGSQYKASLNNLTVKEFRDGEIRVRFEDHIEGKDVYIFQSAFDPQSPRSIHDNIWELYETVDNARFHKANHITVISPYFPYLRQDKPTPYKREPLTAQLELHILKECGADNLVVYDPHFPQLLGYERDLRVHTLASLDLFKQAYQEILKEHEQGVKENPRTKDGKPIDELLLVSPDAGYAKSLELFAKIVNNKFAIGYKTRNELGDAKVLEVTGKFKYVRTAIVKDDIMDSGGSLYEIIKKIHELGVENIYVMITHALLNEPALERLEEMHKQYNLKHAYFLKTIYHDATIIPPYVTFLPIAEELAKVINAIAYDVSVSKRFVKVEK